MLTQDQWEKINEIILNINSVKKDHLMRRVFLEKLQELVEYDFSDFTVGMLKKGTYPCLFDPVVVSKYSKNFEEDFIYLYESTFAPMDYINWVFLSGESIAYRESDLLNEEIRKKSPFYHQYLEVFGFVYIAGLVIASEGQFVGAVTLYRTEKKEDFTNQEIHILKQLLPHLQNKYNSEQEKNNISKNSRSYQLKNRYKLTNREAEVMSYIYNGMNNENIAKELGIALNTVKKHIYNLYDKLGVCNRVQLTRFVYNHGLQNLWKNEHELY